MQQQVTVVAVENGRALVEARRASACGGCAGKASCGTMGSWSDRFARLWVSNDAQARVGDEVLLETPDGMVLQAAFELYGVPMIAFIVLGLAARVLAVQLGWPAPDGWAAGGGITGVFAAYAWILHRGREKDITPQARIVRILHTSSSRASPTIPIRPV